jgi:hypothetical protein
MACTPRLTFHDQGFWMQLLTHLFLVHNYPSSTYIGINGAFWSLAIEAQLYLMYPALLMLVSKLGWRRTMVILAGCELLLRGMYGLIDTMGATNTIWGDISGLFSRSPLYYCIFRKKAVAFYKNFPDLVVRFGDYQLLYKTTESLSVFIVRCGDSSGYQQAFKRDQT